MSAYTPQFAPFVVLAFLGTGLLLVASVLLLLIGLLRKSRNSQYWGLLSGAFLLASYGGILLGLSLFSREVLLPPGSKKYFCEIDCHLAYSVVDARVSPNVGPEMQQIASTGKFVVVQLKTWFDPTTISAHRGNGPLTPNERTVLLQDNAGHSFKVSARSEIVLSALGLSSTPFSTPLRPGESYGTYVVFEVPSGAGGLRLLVTSADRECAFIWTDENSLWHKKIYFGLGPA